MVISDENNYNRNYTFTIRNSNGKETVSIYLDFTVIYCEDDGNGFPKSIAIEGGNLIQIKCDGVKSGLISRKCYLITDLKKSKWGEIIDGCTTSDGVVAGIVIGVICGVIIIVFGVVICVMKSGIIRKRATSTVLSNNNSSSINEKQTHLVESEKQV